FGRVTLAGDYDAAAAMVRAMIGQLVVFHSPDDLRICVCATPERIGRWQWVKWLPHNLHPTERDAAGPVRLMAPTLSQLEALLGQEFAERPRFSPGRADCSLPYHLVVVDGVHSDYGDQLGVDGVDGVTVVDLSGNPVAADSGVLRLRVSHGRIEMI